MARKLPEHIKLILFLVVLGVTIACLYAYVQATQPPPVVAAGRITVSLVVDGLGWTIDYGPVETTNNTPYALLQEAAHRLGFSVQEMYYTVPSAVFVTAINGTTNGQDGMFWQYWVNSLYGDVGADHYALSNGDVVTWRFTADQGGSLG